MGRASRWIKGLFGMKKEKDQSEKSSSLAQDKKEKKCSMRDDSIHITSTTRAPAFDNAWLSSYVAEREDEQKKLAIFVRSLSHGRGTLFNRSMEKLAAVKIQSFFRGYLVCLSPTLSSKKIHIKSVLRMSFIFIP